MTVCFTYFIARVGSPQANGREPRSCLGRVFNFKLGCLVMYSIYQHSTSLELITRPSGLYYKHVTIVISDRNDIGLYYKPRDDRN
jgi:hypothetical protein